MGELKRKNRALKKNGVEVVHFRVDLKKFQYQEKNRVLLAKDSI